MGPQFLGENLARLAFCCDNVGLLGYSCDGIRTGISGEPRAIGVALT